MLLTNTAAAAAALACALCSITMASCIVVHGFQQLGAVSTWNLGSSLARRKTNSLLRLSCAPSPHFPFKLVNASLAGLFTLTATGGEQTPSTTHLVEAPTAACKLPSRRCSVFHCVLVGVEHPWNGRQCEKRRAEWRPACSKSGLMLTRVILMCLI